MSRPPTHEPAPGADPAAGDGAPSTATRRLLLVAWLTAVWCALWEDVRPGALLAGLAVATAVALLVRLGPREPRSAFRPLWAARFGAWFAWALLTSTGRVVWQVVRPGPPPTEGIIAVPLRGVSDTVITIVANAISLTPGTLTVEARRGDPAVIYVHVLGLDDVEAARRDILDLEARAVRAFGSPEAVAALATPPSGGAAAVDPAPTPHPEEEGP